MASADFFPIVHERLLTYMSIQARIAELVKKGELAPVVPTDPSMSRMRDVFASREVVALLTGAKGIKPALLGPAGAAQAIFERFTAGKTLTMRMDPHSGSHAIFARNAKLKDRICDVRVLAPRPQLRIFGAFAERDVFVALTYQKRDLLNFSLGVQRCRKQWDLLFPELEPVLSENVNDYISDAVVAV